MSDVNASPAEDRPRSDPGAANSLSFRFHPRALAALGRDLVTSDVVAVMELVKNSYDALATRVEIRIHTSVDGNAAPYIEILDDGVGMDYETVRDVWCVVATPFRRKNPVSSASGKSRAATGDKGLGRLSAARLGRRFMMVTKTAGGPALKFSLSWTEMFGADDAAGLVFPVKAGPTGAIPDAQGTLIRISGLNEEWTREKIDKLRANLSRFVSPFASETDFALLFDAPESGRETSLEAIQPPSLHVPAQVLD